ncbi:hypothetical protein HKBW3S42_00278 [Candidatus Hakubella thermalkaliphila]|uniref:Vitamin K epoxide reductase domain-containing protein n=1 Tax=Candidatus Hakubella thermalkaliphila TaxID=2754717 RepID=A0A6V8PQP0_9ACTN|nr:vitamin K epoxide reductase family protein [Candidatus Hakubella thermalkaliphila]GFP24640.1 hypothetical protein HKBW3S25_00078 [Candidatus Hakubella thermalkaliphila]GFP31972.1 hypothetical protein HKBW3S42_00278 [Candidatus Hakubella thermalkaliphila]GFP34959.1 hypothetical protein HKBW3S43_00751 [Candidatus Hakubella thermalkaliphila]
MKNKIIVALAIIGIILAGYLIYLHYSPTEALLCAEGSGCDVVNKSVYSKIWGIPVAALGLLMYLSILVLAILAEKGFHQRTALLSIFFVSLAGVVFSAYLTYVQFFVLYAVCSFCLASAADILLIFGISVTNLGR